MFRSALSVATRGLRTRGVRNFSDAAAFPKKGLAEGGHPNVLQKEGNWKKTWFGEAAAYPIIVITGFACSFAFYKVCIYDALSPDAHWSKHKRGTLDFIENKRGNPSVGLLDFK